MTKKLLEMQKGFQTAFIDASSDSGLKIFLFVKKSDGEGTDFYYMGRVHPIAWEQKEIYNDKGVALPIMNFQLKLENSVREDIYQYFVSA